MQNDQLEIVHFLLVHGINPDVRCKPNNQTPLHIACLKGHVYCVSDLLQFGADINAVDEQQQNCFQKAERGRKKDLILPLLRSRGEQQFKWC